MMTVGSRTKAKADFLAQGSVSEPMIGAVACLVSVAQTQRPDKRTYCPK
jgi:hypothetical protein